jgi:hypothetical protein
MCTKPTDCEVQENVSAPDHEDKSDTLVESRHCYQTFEDRTDVGSAIAMVAP